MSASDNISAGIFGASEAARDILGQYINYHFARKLKKATLADELELLRQRQPIERAELLTRKRQEADIDVEKSLRLLGPQTEAKKDIARSAPVGMVYNADTDTYTPAPFAGKITVDKGSKLPRKIITSEQAQQLRNAGVDVNDQEYVIHDVPAGAQKTADIPKDANWIISEVDRILPLNEKSSGGFFGGLRQKTMGALDIEDEKFRNTADVVNSARSMVARVLKSTFGGQLSDSEREYLNSVYGAMSNYSRSERRIALTNVKRMMQEKIGVNVFTSPLDINEKVNTENMAPGTSNGWDPLKESRYQELLIKKQEGTLR